MSPTQIEKENSGQPPKKGANKKPGRFSLWLDDLRCHLTIQKWRRSQKKSDKRQRLFDRIARLPYVDVAGNALYMIGFWAEYLGVCALRTANHVVSAVFGNAAQVLLMILRPFIIGLITLCEDLTSPFIRMASGLRHIRELPEDLPEGDQRTIRKEKVRYFRRGAKLYLPLVWSALSYLLPVGAAVVLVVAVRNELGRRYILNVQVNGQSVGYVESEQVFESAREDVQSRINSAKAGLASAGTPVDDAQWEINPTYTLVTSGETMTESDVTDAILRASSDEISDGTAVYIDGALNYVTTEGDHLRTYLENVKDPYEDNTDPNKRIEFVHNIQLVDGVYFTKSIASYQSVIDSLNANSTPVIHTVAEGETPATIEQSTGLTYDALRRYNPSIGGQDDPLPADSELILGYGSNLLQIKTVVRSVYQEDIPYDSTTSESDEYDFGKVVTLQEGVPGIQEVTQDQIYIDGTVVDTQRVNVTVLQNPVAELIVKGTKLKSGMIAKTGSGTFVWPVPRYSYVSRWMSAGHTGADICAPYGTEIIASDSGKVETSGYHYSYGNYIVIDHGNGYKTLYAHMSGRAVEAGQAVVQGQVIGYVGSTGNSTGNHCHFEMYLNGVRFSAVTLFGGM
ncbi:MAG: peptidoglycan DD-metalloendopeptidase family protein [Gemmiger sp.]|nr:peptidoglycan DD-metalloendopeptidase family protein [Gemmiger sp.]